MYTIARKIILGSNSIVRFQSDIESITLIDIYYVCVCMPTIYVLKFEIYNFRMR